jgi:hypothetical protein
MRKRKDKEKDRDRGALTPGVILVTAREVGEEGGGAKRYSCSTHEDLVIKRRGSKGGLSLSLRRVLIT